jgi:tetratricopeptide (TPR) repeat protein
MYRVYPSARYLKTAGQGLLALAGLLYLLAVLLLAPTHSPLLYGLIFILVSLPFLVMGWLFFWAGSGRYILTGDALLWKGPGGERCLAYQDIHSYRLVGTFPRADLMLLTDRSHIKISHQVEGFAGLYQELRRRVEVMQDVPLSNVPWELRLQPEHVRSGFTGQLAIVLLAGLIAVLVTYLSQDLDLLRAYLGPGATPARLAFGMLIVTVLITTLGVWVSLTDLIHLNSLSFQVGEIHSQHLFGRERVWQGQEVIQVSRQRHEQLFRGGTRVDYPLYILFANGDKLELTDSWAAAHGADLDRLQDSLRWLYLAPQSGRAASPHDRAAAEALIQQADQDYRLARYAEALKAYQQAVELFPAYRSYNLQVGDLLQQLEQYQAAVSAYQDLLEFAPQHDQGWKGLGECWLQTGLYEQAAQAFERSAEINPEDSSVYYAAAQAYIRLNNRARARLCLQKALRLRPELTSRLQEDPALQELL